MDCFYKVANNCVDFVRLIVICIMRCPLNHDEWKTDAMLPSLVIGSNLSDLVLVSKQQNTFTRNIQILILRYEGRLTDIH